MKNKIAFALILALGAPAAAELAAPELPFIDAAVVRSQPFEKESINIGAAFPGMQACKFTGVQGDTCSFACKDGSTVKRPRLNSTVAQNGGCPVMVMVPAGAPKAVADATVTMPLREARNAARELGELASWLTACAAPREYRSGVAASFEKVNSGLAGIDAGIAAGDNYGVYRETILVERAVAEMAALSRSLEGTYGYDAYRAGQLMNLAVRLERSMAEIRLNAPFAF
jgi:hypothetical protein